MNWASLNCLLLINYLSILRFVIKISIVMMNLQTRLGFRLEVKRECAISAKKCAADSGASWRTVFGFQPSRVSHSRGQHVSPLGVLQVLFYMWLYFNILAFIKGIWVLAINLRVVEIQPCLQGSMMIMIASMMMRMLMMMMMVLVMMMMVMMLLLLMMMVVVVMMMMVMMMMLLRLLLLMVMVMLLLLMMMVMVVVMMVMVMMMVVVMMMVMLLLLTMMIQGDGDNDDGGDDDDHHHHNHCVSFPHSPVVQAAGPTALELFQTPSLTCGSPANETIYDHLEGIAQRHLHPPYAEPEVAMIFKKNEMENIDLTEIENSLRQGIQEVLLITIFIVLLEVTLYYIIWYKGTCTVPAVKISIILTWTVECLRIGR